MLNVLKSLIAPKAHIRIIMRGALTMESGIKLQNTVRDMGFRGWIRVTRSYAEIELEGAQPKLESAAIALQQKPFFTGPMVFEQAWLPYKDQFSTFRVAS